MARRQIPVGPPVEQLVPEARVPQDKSLLLLPAQLAQGLEEMLQLQARLPTQAQVAVVVASTPLLIVPENLDLVDLEL